MCLGFREGKGLVLVNHELTNTSVDERLFFDDLPPTISPMDIRYMPMVLFSHPGKAIVLTHETRQHGHGMEQMMKVGDEKDAMWVFKDADNHIHNYEVPFQTFDGHDHHQRDLEFFTKHVDYGHMKYKAQVDGTILFLHDDDFVLGTDEKAERVMHVNKNSEHKFVFRDIRYLL